MNNRFIPAKHVGPLKHVAAIALLAASAAFAASNAHAWTLKEAAQPYSAPRSKPYSSIVRDTRPHKP